MRYYFGARYPTVPVGRTPRLRQHGIKLTRPFLAAIFLDDLTGGGGVLGILLSSGLIVVFGEVLPQALCAQHGLRVGAACTGFVRALVSFGCVSMLRTAAPASASAGSDR